MSIYQPVTRTRIYLCPVFPTFDLYAACFSHSFTLCSGKRPKQACSSLTSVLAKEISTALLCSRILQKKNAFFHLSGKVVGSCDLTILPWRPGFKLCQQLQSENCRQVCPHQQFCLRESRAEAAKRDRDEGEPLC